MKKTNKKISLISLVSILTISSIGYVGYQTYMHYQINSESLNAWNNDSKSFVDENKDILFNGKNYLNVADATDQILASDQVSVNDNLYIGDLSNAIINTNNYNLVNTNKLKPYDTSKLNKAYKTSLGTYTKDYNEAKKTMIGSTEVRYMDYEFNQYRSEARAKDAILSKTNSIPISYYKIKDPVDNKIVNINPLNKNDQIKLKKIALNSVTGLNSPNETYNDFSLEKYYINQKNKDPNLDINYTRAEEGNWSKAKDKKKIYNSLLTNIYNNLIKTLVFDARIQTNISNKVINWTYFGENYANVSYQINYFGGYNPTSSDMKKQFDIFSFNKLINDASIFQNYNKFIEKFNIEIDHPLAYENVFSRKAIAKPNIKIFGFDNISILYNGDRPFRIHGTHNALPPNAVQFYLNAAETHLRYKSNITFNLQFTPRGIKENHLNEFSEYFKNIMMNDAGMDETIKSFSNTKSSKSIFDITNDFNYKYENANASKIELIEKRIIDKLLVSTINFLNNNENKTAQIMSNSISLDKKINSKEILNDFFNLPISSPGIDEIDREQIVKQLDHSILDDLQEYVNLKYDNLERIDNNDVIYTINYKGNPLFLLNDTKVDFNLNDNEYNKMIEKLNIFKEKNLIDKNLINISNNLKLEKNSNKNKLSLTQKNNQVNKDNNFLSLPEDKNNSIIDISKQLNYFNIFENNLYAALNQNIKDELITNKYGILQSIYYYNQNIKNTNETYLDKSLLINDSDDIVVLWTKDQSLEEIYYGELLGNKREINSPLNNSYSKTIYNSLEELNNAKSTILKLEPIQVFIVRDHFNNILNYQTFDPNQPKDPDKIISDGYGTNEEIAYQNALNKITLFADLEFLFYENTLVKNEVNKLYSLTLKKSLTNNANDLTYTFLKYKDMYSYLYDYIKLNSVNIYN